MVEVGSGEGGVCWRWGVVEVGVVEVGSGRGGSGGGREWWR